MYIFLDKKYLNFNMLNMQTDRQTDKREIIQPSSSHQRWQTIGRADAWAAVWFVLVQGGSGLKWGAETAYPSRPWCRCSSLRRKQKHCLLKGAEKENTTTGFATQAVILFKMMTNSTFIMNHMKFPKCLLYFLCISWITESLFFTTLQLEISI